MRGHSFFLLLVFLAAGCQNIPPAETHIQGTSRNAVLSTAADVRLSPAYKQAVSSFEHRDYTRSLTQLSALANAPERTAPEKVFLARQIELCRKKLGQKSALPASDAPSATVSASDCGPRALMIVCRDVFHIPASLSVLSQTAKTTRQGTSLAGMAKAAQFCGLHAEGVQLDKNALENLSCPALAWVDGNHYIAVLNVHPNPWTGKMSATIHDPNKLEQEEISATTLLGRSGGVLLVLSLPPTSTKKSS